MCKLLVAAGHDTFKASKQGRGDARKKQAGEQSMPAQLNNVAIKNKYTRCYPLSPSPRACGGAKKEHTSLPIRPNMHLNFVPNIFHAVRRGSTLESLCC